MQGENQERFRFSPCILFASRLSGVVCFDYSVKELMVVFSVLFSVCWFAGMHQYRNNDAMSKTTIDIAMMPYMNERLDLRILCLIVIYF